MIRLPVEQAGQPVIQLSPCHNPHSMAVAPEGDRSPVIRGPAAAQGWYLRIVEINQLGLHPMFVKAMSRVCRSTSSVIVASRISGFSSSRLSKPDIAPVWVKGPDAGFMPLRSPADALPSHQMPLVNVFRSLLKTLYSIHPYRGDRRRLLLGFLPSFPKFHAVSRPNRLGLLLRLEGALFQWAAR